MHWMFALVLGWAMACGSRSTPATASGSGSAGAVCSCHRAARERGESCVAVTCAADLVCGYPCGIDGCNSVCMTRKDHDESHNIP